MSETNQKKQKTNDKRGYDLGNGRYQSDYCLVHRETFEPEVYWNGSHFDTHYLAHYMVKLYQEHYNGNEIPESERKQLKMLAEVLKAHVVLLYLNNEDNEFYLERAMDQVILMYLETRKMK